MVNWMDEFPAAITVIDAQGTILAMNHRSAEIFEERGGVQLIGQDAAVCHPPREQKMLAALLKTHRRHIYTMELDEKKVLVYQSPWYTNGEFSGFVELVLPIPLNLPRINPVPLFFK